MTEENQNRSDDPRIIVDEDWKSQVEREKEELRRQQATQTDGGTASPADKKSAPSMPPASFSFLLSTLATQAMVGLGILPDPDSGKPVINRPLAKHMIDTLGMLAAKTKGNLTAEETEQLDGALHQLRMIYVSSGKDSESPDTNPESQPSKPSTIELP